MKPNMNKYQAVIDAQIAATPKEIDEFTKKAFTENKSGMTSEELLIRFKQAHPGYSTDFLELAPVHAGEHKEMMLMKMRHKKEASEIYKRGLANGTFKKKPWITQQDYDLAYRMAASGDYNTGTEVLVKQSESKETGWLEAAKVSKSPTKIREARSKVVAKKDNRRLAIRHLTQPRATNETNQPLPGALQAFINNDKALALLIDHEVRLQDSEARHNRAELNIAALQAEIAMLKGESRADQIKNMINEGFTHTQVAESLKISRSTVTRELARVINPK